MARELEDRIQQLCARVTATDDDDELYRLCVELRQALNEHITQIRKQVADFTRSSQPRSRKKGNS